MLREADRPDESEAGRRPWSAAAGHDGRHVAPGAVHRARRRSGLRLGPLTTGRAKPSLPVGGHYRLIDVSLSNATHSGLTDVWVLEQYEPHLLNEHLAGGRPWDLDRTRGGFRVLPPFEGYDRDGFAGGNADALARNWPVIEAFDPDVLLVCSADHLLTIDYRTWSPRTWTPADDVTIVTTTLPRGSDASRYLVVQRDGDRVSGGRLQAGPAAGPNGRHRDLRLPAAPAAGRGCGRCASTGGDLGDYGERLMPRMVDDGAAGAFNHDGPLARPRHPGGLPRRATRAAAATGRRCVLDDPALADPHVHAGPRAGDRAARPPSWIGRGCRRAPTSPARWSTRSSGPTRGGARRRGPAQRDDGRRPGPGRAPRQPRGGRRGRGDRPQRGARRAAGPAPGAGRRPVGAIAAGDRLAAASARAGECPRDLLRDHPVSRRAPVRT